LIGKLMGLNDFGLYGFFLSGLVLMGGSRVFRLLKMRE